MPPVRFHRQPPEKLAPYESVIFHLGNPKNHISAKVVLICVACSRRSGSGALECDRAIGPRGDEAVTVRLEIGAGQIHDVEIVRYQQEGCDCPGIGPQRQSPRLDAIGLMLKVTKRGCRRSSSAATRGPRRDGIRAVARCRNRFADQPLEHNEEPFIDGNGCEILGDGIPGADEMAISDDVWEPDYIAYLAFAMVCSDDMPALCARALAIHGRAVARSARWLARCAEDAEAVEFLGGCEGLTRSASPANYEQRQAFRRRLVRMFRRATEYSG